MVCNKLIFTVAGNGLATGGAAQNIGQRTAKKKVDKVTAAISARSTPAPAQRKSSTPYAHVQALSHDLAIGADGHNVPNQELLSSPSCVDTPYNYETLSSDMSTSQDPVGSLPPRSNRNQHQEATPDIQPSNEPVLANADIVPTTEDDSALTVSYEEDETNAIVFESVGTERQYYRELNTGNQREIWRPGDGDGMPGADYYERPGQLPPVEKRWRLYQSKTGAGPVVNITNMPPKYVILDDRAAHDVLTSDIPRAQLPKLWSHDFGGAGKVRFRRPHRGRGAVETKTAEGDKKYYHVDIGTKRDRYFFTGDKDYKPVIYRIANVVPEQTETPAVPPKKRKATSPPSNEPTPLKAAGHNQYTPKDQMVRYGAHSDAQGRKRYRSRVNAFLRRSPSPTWTNVGSRHYDSVDDRPKVGGCGSADGLGDMGSLAGLEDVPDSIWVEQDVDFSVVDINGEVGTTKDRNSPLNEPQDDLSSNDASFHSPLADSSLEDANVLGFEGISVESAVEKPRRTKPARPMSYMERTAAEEETHVDDSPHAHDKSTTDSGSYAMRLERELAEAGEERKRLTTALQNSQDRVGQLESEVQVLRETMAATRDDSIFNF